MGHAEIVAHVSMAESQDRRWDKCEVASAAHIPQPPTAPACRHLFSISEVPAGLDQNGTRPTHRDLPR